MSKIDENWGMLRSEWEGLVDDPKNIQVEQLLSNIIRAEERIPRMVQKGRLTPEEVKDRKAEIEYAKGLVKKHVTPAMIENLKDDPISKQLFAVKQAGGVEKVVAFAKKITSEKGEPAKKTPLSESVIGSVRTIRQLTASRVPAGKEFERKLEQLLKHQAMIINEGTPEQIATERAEHERYLAKLEKTAENILEEWEPGDENAYLMTKEEFRQSTANLIAKGKKNITSPKPAGAPAEGKKGGGGGGKPGKPNAYWAKVREIQKTGVPEAQAKKRAEKELSGDSGDSGDSFDTPSQFNRRWDPSRQKWINSDSYDAL